MFVYNIICTIILLIKHRNVYSWFYYLELKQRTYKKDINCNLSLYKIEM